MGKMYIKEEIGDLLTSNCKIRCHQVNYYGIMGAGIAKQIKEKYPEAYKPYAKLCDMFGSKLLGYSQIIPCHDETIIANLFSQADDGTYIPSLIDCLDSILYFVETTGASVGFPKYMGAGIGGGDWKEIRYSIDHFFNNEKIDCTIVEWEKNEQV